jgi:hypothetical protein
MRWLRSPLGSTHVQLISAETYQLALLPYIQVAIVDSTSTAAILVVVAGLPFVLATCADLCSITLNIFDYTCIDLLCALVHMLETQLEEHDTQCECVRVLRIAYSCCAPRILSSGPRSRAKVKKLFEGVSIFCWGGHHCEDAIVRATQSIALLVFAP